MDEVGNKYGKQTKEVQKTEMIFLIRWRNKCFKVAGAGGGVSNVLDKLGNLLDSKSEKRGCLT